MHSHQFTLIKLNSILSLVVLIPHLGTATLRTESDMARIAALNVLNVLEGYGMVAPAFDLD